jgi:FkbM family methyltransferase
MTQAILFHKTRRGVITHFAADQCIGKSLARYGEWAEDEIALLRHYLTEGSTALDVGANVGVHTLAFAEMVGATGSVIAIEGQPEVSTLLAYNIVANELSDRVKIVAALAGSKPALVPYLAKVPNENMGALSFVQNVHEPEKLAVLSGLRITLPLITIDSLNLSSCALIKIDVEGMEEDVLAGATETLRLCRSVVYFEYANNDIDQLCRMHGMLRKLGYRLFWHVANPFNKLNYRGDTYNIFGGNVEVNVLAVLGHHNIPTLPEIIDPTIAPPRPTLAEGLIGVEVKQDDSNFYHRDEPLNERLLRLETAVLDVRATLLDDVRRIETTVLGDVRRLETSVLDIQLLLHKVLKPARWAWGLMRPFRKTKSKPSKQS